MVLNKSLDESKIIAACLYDVFAIHGAVFNSSSRRNTLMKCAKRLEKEGIGFLTKTLPQLGKAFDKAISGDTPLNAVSVRFEPSPNSQLPRFLGELFSRVLDPVGVLLPHPCTDSVRSIRQICYLFYKYKLPYSAEQEHEVISKFTKTENDLISVDVALEQIQRDLNETTKKTYRKHIYADNKLTYVARRARWLLSNLFSRFDPKDIIPRHGPGAVATKQQLWNKFLWTNVSANITKMYPLDEYFYASAGHFCDTLQDLYKLGDADLPARVILVPKDSRGPRLISCEPVDYQWVQQGLGRAIVKLVEHNELTKFNVHFTDQVPNRCGALLGSATGRYSTLDLKEASDRVSLELVRLLFPPHICEYLESCRTSATVLPTGEVLKLRKFAPMGSCLCFPIMALTIWAILTAAEPDAKIGPWESKKFDYQEPTLLVYGDDVIVPTAKAEDAISILESFGLVINRDKSCISGLFRESCGMDAFQGADVTPVRLRTVWADSPSPDIYSSYIAYANAFWDKRMYRVYDEIVEALHRIYGTIPADDMSLSTRLSLRYVTDDKRPKRRRHNKHLQKMQYYVRDVKSPTITKDLNGWSMLLRYFSECSRTPVEEPVVSSWFDPDLYGPSEPVSVSSYTRRQTSMLVRRWR